MATHSSVLAGRIPWAEEPGRLQSIGLHRVGQTNQFSMHAYNHFTGHMQTQKYRSVLTEACGSVVDLTES